MGTGRVEAAGLVSCLLKTYLDGSRATVMGEWDESSKGL